MSLSLISGKSAYLHDGYIVTIENCCAPTAVKCTLMPTRRIIAVRHLVKHVICYALNVIVIRHLVQHKVVATELYT